MSSLEENLRMATLTSDAVRASGKQVTKNIMDTVEAAETTARTLREEAEQLVREIQKHTDMFADRVNVFVVNCHDAVEMLKEHKAKIFDDIDVPIDTRPPVPLLTTPDDQRPS